MDPARKRQVRLGVSLAVVVLLAGGLVYTSFSASTEAKQPSQLLIANPDRSYDLTGKVAAGTVRHTPRLLRFSVRDRDGTKQIPVRYSGAIPDPFREGREVVVTGRVRGGVFYAERDTLVTKCPSKFSDKPQTHPS